MEKNLTCEEIAESYVSLVIAEYPDATIVFDDGYISPSTKDMTHKGEKSLKASPTIHINNYEVRWRYESISFEQQKQTKIHKYPWGKVVITWLAGDLL